MPKRDRTTPTTEQPRCIRPFTYHGVEFFKQSSKEWIGICPFCDKNKFHVDSETGMADCKVCLWNEQFKEDGVTGNHYGFIKYLWRVSYNQTKEIDYGWLIAHRQLSYESLREWGVCKSVITGEWIIPGYGVKDPPNITQLYVFKNLKQKDGSYKYELCLTPGFAEGEAHGIILPRDYSGNANRLYVCEGAWDAIALSSALPLVHEGSLRGEICAVPGCGIWKEQWSRYTKNKDVVFLYDNDHPHKNEDTGTIHQPGLSGTKRAVGLIHSTAKSISWLDWGMNGKGYDPHLADGYDIRDWFVKDKRNPDRLFSLIKPIPDGWINNNSNISLNKNSVPEKVKPIPCRSWKQLQEAFKLAAKWTPELDAALAVSLACVCSVNGIGEPLWCRLLSPPATYKSMLCKALGTNDKYTIMDDGMNGFYSGMVTKDGEDYSLVTKWNGKCLITKEGSTLFTNKLCEQIIGEARAIYDGDITRRWKNGKEVSHKGWRGTWLLAGTPNMKDYDDNELGPRFIDCRIVKNMSEELEDDILMQAMVQQANSGIANCTIDSTENPNYLYARKLCGGYINYLRQDYDDGTLPLPQVSYENLTKIHTLSKFVERMRSRPPRKNPHSENTDMASPFRVGKQLIKLAQFVCIVKQKNTIDKEVIDVVSKVALDTSDGWSLELVDALRNASLDGDEGLDPFILAKRCNKTFRQIESLVIYLPIIGVLEWYKPKDMPSPITQERLRLTNSFRILYNQVKEIEREL